MAGENFSHAAKVQFTHVPYRGEAAAYTDLMAGQIDVVVGNIGAVSSLVDSGRVDALAVTSKERASMLPNVPTVSEAGVPGFEGSRTEDRDRSGRSTDDAENLCLEIL